MESEPQFVDTNLLIYLHDESSDAKHAAAKELIHGLEREAVAAASLQVLVEFYSVMTRKLRMDSRIAEDILVHLGTWTLHRPEHADLLRAAQLQRHHKLSWWDAMLVNSAIQLGCSVLWTEDLHHNQKIGTLRVRNPFR